VLAFWCLGTAARAQGTSGDTTAPPDEWYSLHAQSTFTVQYHPGFSAAVAGPNSLSNSSNDRETLDATLFAGIRLLPGLEAYVDPEIDQGFGLNDTVGVAGFTSAEAYKIGSNNPYYETQRAFVRYTLGLGGEAQKVESGPNQIAGTRQADNIVITAGKFSATDIFDQNAYAHDPRSDFLNWSVVDSAAYDYAADAWGYSYGAAVEWTQSWWTLRAGFFDLSNTPNEVNIDPTFTQFELVTEFEERHELFGQPGKARLLFFNNRGRMANYNDAVRFGEATGTTPDLGAVRRYSSRPAMALNLEQAVVSDLGAFLRASLNDGHKESYEFTDVNRSVAAGLSLAGTRWGRPDDTVAIAGVINGASKDMRNYLAAGGLGILIGDGSLPAAGLEKILELYYKAAVGTGIAATIDYQHVENPGYDALRGPVNVISIRLHAEF